MAYLDDNLASGEHVAYQTRMHSYPVFKGLLSSFAVYTVSGLLLTMAHHHVSREVIGVLALLVILFGSIPFWIEFIRQRSSVMAVTDRRVLIKMGVFNQRSVELVLSKIEGIAVDQTFLGRLLGFGTVVITGTGGTHESFDLIRNPMEFRKKVQEQIGSPAYH